MLRFRTGYRTVRLLRRSLLWLAVLIMSCSLVSMGGLIWINNSWVVFPDGDPATSFDSSLLLEILAGQSAFSDLDPDGDGQLSVAGGQLLKGNGARDDNRQGPIEIVARPGEIITPCPFSAPVVSWAHRAVSSYLGFGHLKVFPDAISSLIIAENITYYSLKATTIYLRGVFLVGHEINGGLSLPFDSASWLFLVPCCLAGTAILQPTRRDFCRFSISYFGQE